MVNKDGKVVSAVPEAIMAAAAGADWTKAPGFYMILTDAPGAKSWPIAGATFILVPKQPKDIAATKEALKFFAWAYKNGGEMASSLDYIPMPANVVSLIEAKWKSDIKDAEGKPIF
jgi:phosphate transport system substrate-binding protein